ncbi:lysyl oxidase family protein [Streptomyces coacervatus]|uniref:lysyl oxidase family protein n=1 Tax=Streptomyces coacervatus TaxID=647381 RepID=UPI0023DCA2FA|nr:lysyl oxidase family protein [Streptomyces coacervatus]MDF2273440.1 lysyl oxidase family protein [Streptomyces coacervatus]
MNRHHPTALRRSAIIAAAALTVGAAGTLAAPGAGAATPTGAPKLQLIAASPSVTVDRFEGEPGVYLDLGTYITVDGGPLEMRVTRKSYNDAVVASQVIRSGGRTVTKTLPTGLVKDFSGLPDFLKVNISDASGAKVADTTQSFCPNNRAGRIRPDAPATSKYPTGCSDNPFALGGVWGVENGWAAATSQGFRGDNAINLPAGVYTAKVSVAKKYRDLFGMADKTQTVKVTVRQNSGGGQGLAGVNHGQKNASKSPKPAAKRPVGRAAVPADVPKPDLRALPAYGIAITDGDEGGAGAVPGKDYLAFSATVWNGGPSPLVVDGFRKPGAEKMDAYQYFYDAKGKQVGYTPTGTMEWDPREGHQHWHFSDFASYRLLGADKREIVRSGKEAFCLANTDAIDYTVKNANWHPYNTDLATACGEQTAVSVREVLDVGNGDTYSQYRPGQSFDVSDLPNGTYYIQVIANPDNRLKEQSTANNVTYRKVVLGGTPGARTVTVPKYGLIDAP